MSLVTRIARFARSPQGRRFVSEAARYARSPKARRQMQQVRTQIAARKRGRPR
jgi:hypothetical protein